MSSSQEIDLLGQSAPGANPDRGDATDFRQSDPQWCQEFATAHSPDGVVLADPELRVVWANPAAERLLGHRIEDLGGTEMLDFVHPEDASHALGAVSEASRTDGYHVATRLRLHHADGGHIACRVTANTVQHAGRTWFVLGVRSVGDEDAIESRRRRLRSLATSFYVDCASMEWTDAPERSRVLLAGLGAALDADAIEIAEFAEDHARVTTVVAWGAEGIRVPGPVGGTRVVPQVQRLMELPCRFEFSDGRFAAEVWLSSTTGEDGVVTIDLGDHPDQWDDANADVVSLMCSSLMATVRRCNRERAVAMAATRDPLTGLLNRTAMQERLEELMSVAAVGGEAVSVFFVDLNDFKALNDTAGHNAGDKVLCEVADALRGAIRPGDLAARVGGDEFVVVMMTRRRALERLEARLRESIEAAIDPSTGVGVAIGAILVGAGEGSEEILERADAAMYADKRRGRSRATRNPAAGGPRLNAAMESLSVMLAVDSDAHLLTATRAAYSVFGFEPGASLGMNVLEVVHPDDRPLAVAAFEEARATPGPGEPITIRVVDADGGVHRVRISGNNQLDNPEIAGIVMTLVDAEDPGGPGEPLGSGHVERTALQQDA